MESNLVVKFIVNIYPRVPKTKLNLALCVRPS